MAFYDADKRDFDGAKTYKVTLPPNIPAAKFWSFTVYDNQTRSMLDTPRRYPRAGSQIYPSLAAVPNADGSTTVYFGPKLPPGVQRFRDGPGAGLELADLVHAYRRHARGRDPRPDRCRPENPRRGRAGQRSAAGADRRQEPLGAEQRHRRRLPGDVQPRRSAADQQRVQRPAAGAFGSGQRARDRLRRDPDRLHHQGRPDRHVLRQRAVRDDGLQDGRQENLQPL